MKGISAVLGLALLMGCNNSDNDCPRKDKSCGKSITTTEAPVEQKEAAQEVASVLESETPSK